MFIRYRPRLFIALLGLTLALAWVSPSRAEDLQPLPELSKTFDLASYASGTDTVAKAFDAMPFAGYEIALPKTWIERASLGQDYGELTHFDGPTVGDVRSYFSYKRLQVPRENSARLELIAYMLKQNYVLRSLKEKDDRNVEALYVMVDSRNDSYVVRTVARIVGPDMLLAEYAVPVHEWDRQRDQQTFAIQSFKFLKDSTDTIEKRVERVYFNALRFYYPASWIFTSEQALADNRVTLTLINKTGSNAEGGRIRLSVVSSKSLKDNGNRSNFAVEPPALLKELRKTYEDQGYVIGNSIESSKPGLNVPTKFSAMEVYEVRKKTSQYDSARPEPVTQELWLAVFSGEGEGDKFYIAELFTPSRKQDIYLWSVNTRAFEIMLKSIQ